MSASFSSAGRGAVAVMTSGGDAPGMNGCLRGAVRCALASGYEIYAVLEGYQGPVQTEP